MDEPDLLSELRSLGAQERDPRAELDALDEPAINPEHEALIGGLTLQHRLDRATTEADAVRKSRAGALGVLGESFGVLNTQEQQDWLRETGGSIRAERLDLDALSSRVSAGRRRLSNWFGEDYVSSLEDVGSLAGPSALERAGTDLSRREREQREREAGTRSLATKTPLRSAVENVPQGTIGLAASIVKGVGIGAGSSAATLLVPTSRRTTTSPIRSASGSTPRARSSSRATRRGRTSSRRSWLTVPAA